MDEAYGGRFLRVVQADVADRLGARQARANARLGFLSPPQGDGRILWIKAGGGSDAVWLAAELAHAVRECRRDVRLIITFEAEHAAILPRIAALKRAGYGYGSCDRRSAVRRVLTRFAPLAGVVTVGGGLRPHLAAALAARSIPVVAVHDLPVEGGDAVAALPNVASEARAWGVRAMACAPLVSMIVEAQVEPQFRGVAGARARALWWVTDVTRDAWPALMESWRASPLAAQDLLFVGGAGAGPRLSQWDRTAYPPGSVIGVDDSRYWPALAASCTGIHVGRPAERLLWQAIASGQVVSAVAPEALDLLDPAPWETVVPDGLMAHWQGLFEEPASARQRADGLRRYFWQQRRRAQDAVAALLARVYAW